MTQGFLRLTIETQRKADKTAGGREVRIEIERRIEMANSLLGLAAGKGNKAERQVRPGITVIEFDRPVGKLGG
jgi:hypothetical protein